MQVGGERYAAADHAPALIQPNPLAQGRYVVLNSGHTFHEKELASLNYLLFPRLGDWAVLQVGGKGPLDETVLRSGFFDEEWRFPEADDSLAPFFHPPKEYADDFGDYKSPLKFYDGSPVKTPDDWPKRRKEILQYWNDAMGQLPPLIEKPKIEYLEKEAKDGYVQHHVRLETAPGRTTDDAYLLVPDGDGPFPAVVVVFYEAKTGVGLGKEPTATSPATGQARLRRPVAGRRPQDVFPGQGKGAIAAALVPRLRGRQLPYDPGEPAAGRSKADRRRRPFLRRQVGDVRLVPLRQVRLRRLVRPRNRLRREAQQRQLLGAVVSWIRAGPRAQAGHSRRQKPATGPYKKLIEEGHDLTELHALMAPRPFLVSGGSEDGPERWKALNHAVAVNQFLGYEDRVAMTNRMGHAPTDESNEQMCLFFERFLK